MNALSGGGKCDFAFPSAMLICLSLSAGDFGKSLADVIASRQTSTLEETSSLGLWTCSGLLNQVKENIKGS